MNTRQNNKVTDSLFRKFDALTTAQKFGVSTMAIALGMIGLMSISESSDGYVCNSAGQTIVVNTTEHNTLWAIGNKYCVGNIAGAVNAMVNKHGALLDVGTVVELPNDQHEQQ